MKFISPNVHRILDYGVAALLISTPLLASFANRSPAAAGISIGSGIGLVIYSLLTDYSADLRRAISFRLHLVLDSIAATALIAAPFAVGFSGFPQAFFIGVGVAVLAAVAFSQTADLETPSLRDGEEPAAA